MNPADTWDNKEAYDSYARKLAKNVPGKILQRNIPNMPMHIAEAGPKAE